MFVLSLTNLVGTNSLATRGVVLENVLKETNKITKENQTLVVEIGKINNLNYIQSVAISLGYKRISSHLTVSPVEVLAAVTE